MTVHPLAEELHVHHQRYVRIPGAATHTVGRTEPWACVRPPFGSLLKERVVDVGEFVAALQGVAAGGTVHTGGPRALRR
ncbi:hypothetical protein GCM10014715_31480 [Streptomyces spiralis]|uniref:Uncharacterized protein n=1 Tax=Streptomyces spiralis TaxID=66376 RepID=A0A919DT17_9ACTN|nr:hypothetical protein GCM10014715_31480 [Streptomyces spiralis]